MAAILSKGRWVKNYKTVGWNAWGNITSPLMRIRDLRIHALDTVMYQAIKTMLKLI